MNVNFTAEEAVFQWVAAVDEISPCQEVLRRMAFEYQEHLRRSTAADCPSRES
jgi:hypothetical protein